jgi:hypothetical protein
VGKEHVSKVKRTVQTLKDQMQGLIMTMPFERVPKQMKIKFVYFVVLWLNAFWVKLGVSATY